MNGIRIAFLRGDIIGLLYGESHEVKSRKFCTFLHAPPLAHKHHQGLLAKDRRQRAHVEILPPALPFLTLLRAERRHQPQARRAVREDADHPRAALQFLIQSLHPVRRPNPLLMRQRERQAGETGLALFFQ